MDIKQSYRYFRTYIIRILGLLLGKRLRIQSKHILILAPHPDDEIFGCAGLIQHFIREQKKVSVVILTQGENALPDCDKNEIVSARKDMATQAASLLKHDLYWGNIEDGQLINSNFDQIFDQIESLNPDAIFVPHYLEGWSDHEATEQKISDWLNKSRKQTKLYHYCVWFWFSMPYSKFNRVRWKNAKTVKMNAIEHQYKKQAIDIYLNNKSSSGKPYSGVLPQEFLFANSWNKELFFEVR